MHGLLVIHLDYLSLPENPAFVAQAQQAFSGLNEQQRNDMGDLAMRANVALSGTGSLQVNSLRQQGQVKSRWGEC